MRQNTTCCPVCRTECNNTKRLETFYKCVHCNTKLSVNKAYNELTFIGLLMYITTTSKANTHIPLVLFLKIFACISCVYLFYYTIRQGRYIPVDSIDNYKSSYIRHVFSHSITVITLTIFHIFITTLVFSYTSAHIAFTLITIAPTLYLLIITHYLGKTLQPRTDLISTLKKGRYSLVTLHLIHSFCLILYILHTGYPLLKQELIFFIFCTAGLPVFYLTYGINLSEARRQFP